MKIIRKDLMAAKPVLTNLFVTDMKSIKLNYTLSKISKTVLDEYENINNVQQKAWDKYGEKKDGKLIILNEKGEQSEHGEIKFTEKNRKSFEKEWDDFVAEEMEMDIWKIPFKCVSVAKLVPIQISVLAPFITVPTEEELNELEKAETPAKTPETPKEDNA